MEQMDDATEQNLEILTKPSVSINQKNFSKSPGVRQQDQYLKSECLDLIFRKVLVHCKLS